VNLDLGHVQPSPSASPVGIDRTEGPTVEPMIRRLLAAVLLTLAVAGAPAVAHAADDVTTTTLPVDVGNHSVIPAPNSGRAPTNPGDPGGWGQLLLFGVLFVGSAIVFGRVLWAGHQRSRANRIP
jgi:hypothetical protein